MARQVDPSAGLRDLPNEWIFEYFKSSPTPHDEIDSLASKIHDLLCKHAVTVIAHHVRQKGFYSMYFLVPKNTGGFRPILDLPLPNQDRQMALQHGQRTVSFNH